MNVRALLDSELSWANECYAAIDFVLSSARDFIVVAEVDGEKAGLGRIVPIDDDTGELGGMFVFPKFRGMAVARKLVAFLIDQATQPRLYCIPFGHLEPFYRSCGFERVPADERLPEAVMKKLAWCERTYPDPVCVLARSRVVTRSPHEQRKGHPA